MALARATSTVPVPAVGPESTSSLHFDPVPLRTGDSDPAVLVEARAGDVMGGAVMAGAGGAAGPAPDVRHQPAGDVFRIQHI